jgi:hypothetical protein
MRIAHILAAAILALVALTLTACGGVQTKPTAPPPPAWVYKKELPEGFGPGVTAVGLGDDEQVADIDARANLTQEVLGITSVNLSTGSVRVEAKGVMIGVNKIATWTNEYGLSFALVYMSRQDLEQTLRMNLVPEDQIKARLDDLAPLPAGQTPTPALAPATTPSADELAARCANDLIAKGTPKDKAIKTCLKQEMEYPE